MFKMYPHDYAKSFLHRREAQHPCSIDPSHVETSETLVDPQDAKEHNSLLRENQFECSMPNNVNIWMDQVPLHVRSYQEILTLSHKTTR